MNLSFFFPVSVFSTACVKDIWGAVSNVKEGCEALSDLAVSVAVAVGTTDGVCTILGTTVGCSIWSIDLRYDGSSILSEICASHLDRYSKCVISKIKFNSRIFKSNGRPNSSRMLISRFEILAIGDGLDSNMEWSVSLSSNV